MSEFEGLPDNIRKAIQDLLDSLSGMTAEQIFDLLFSLLGDDTIADLADIIHSSEELNFYLDDPAILNLDQLLSNPEIESELPVEELIEPYYEFNIINSKQGEIIVDMPGLYEDALIDWYEYEGELYIYSNNLYEEYRLILPIPNYYQIDEPNMTYRNGLFIIPFFIK